MYNLSITDMIGNSISNTTEYATNGKINKVYQLNHLSSGLYLLNIQSNNNSIQKRIVIK